MTETENEILSLAQVLARFKGSIGRKNLIAHIKAVPHFAGGPTHRRNGAKYFFTSSDLNRLLDSLATPPNPPTQATTQRDTFPALPSDEKLFQSLMKRQDRLPTRRKRPKKS